MKFVALILATVIFFSSCATMPKETRNGILISSAVMTVVAIAIMIIAVKR
jgi:hypothetical protein